MNKRLSDLEEATFGRNGGKDIIGVRYDDEDHVRVNGKDISLAEFERLYPDAILIHVVHVDMSLKQD